jgi:hypothetical protein
MTVHLAEAHAHVQRLVSVVKTVTVLEECTTEEQSSVVHLLWSNILNANDFHKKMFPVYGEKCLSRKAIQNCVEKFSEGRSKIVDHARPGAEVAEITTKRLLCCRFRRTGKEIGQVYQCLWRICREINIFPRLEYHIF